MIKRISAKDKNDGKMRIAVSVRSGNNQGSTNWVVDPVCLTIEDGEIVLIHRAYIPDGKSKRQILCKIAANRIKPRSMDVLIDRHNAYMDAHGINYFSAAWNRATNEITVKEGRLAA